jgi:SAM-dependent methyltransferase
MQTFNYRGFDIPVPLIMLTGAGPEAFEETANIHIRRVNDLIGYRPDAFVVEIGCGIGKDAMALTGILDETGRYLGIDIIKMSIEWCQKNITPKHSNFTFVHLDVKDELHNPLGTEDVSVCRIPVAADSVDVIILHSVFTHLLEDGISVYLREFSRVLKPESGRVYATFFVVDEDIRRQIVGSPRTEYSLEFAHPYGDGCWINVPSVPLGAVAYSIEKISQLVVAAGLEFDRPLVRGNWSGCFPGIPGSQQDEVLLRRGDAPASFSAQPSLRETFRRRTRRFFASGLRRLTSS